MGAAAPRPSLTESARLITQLRSGGAREAPLPTQLGLQEPRGRCRTPPGTPRTPPGTPGARRAGALPCPLHAGDGAVARGSIRGLAAPPAGRAGVGGGTRPARGPGGERAPCAVKPLPPRLAG